MTSTVPRAPIVDPTPPTGPLVDPPPTGQLVDAAPSTGTLVDATPPTGLLVDVTPPTGPLVGPTPPAGRSGRLGRSFRRLWYAAALSGAGDGIRSGTLPLFAAALVPEPRAVAAVWFAGGLPFLLFGPVAGVLVDRWTNRRRIMLLADVAAAAIVALVALVVAGGGATVALLVVLNFVLGSVQALRDNAELAAIPALVGPDLLDAANSRLQGSRLLTVDLLGPPAAALLFVALPHATPFALDSLSFVIAAVFVSRIVIPRSAVKAPAPAAPRPSIVAEMRAGLRWLWGRRALRTLCLLTGLTNFAVMSAISVAVLYALQVLHVSRTTYGLLLGTVALGGVLGSLAAPPLGRWLGRGRLLRIAFGLSPLAFLAAGVTSNPLVATAALSMVGVTVGITGVVTVSLRQLLVPADMVGRVNSSYRFVAMGLAPVGALFGGVSAELFGLRAPFIGAAEVLALGWLLTLPTLTNRAVAVRPATTPAPAQGGGEAAAGGGVAAADLVPRRGRVRRWLRRVLICVIVLVTALATGTAALVGWTVRRSYPVVDGNLTVAGLHAPVQVIRDDLGVPQIYADDTHDLFMAQGYVAAQDRFWEMDIRRHITSGTLSELFGPGLVATDAVVRTLGWRDVAEQEISLLSPQTRAYLQAYADGVNAYLAGHSGSALSLEYAVLSLATPGYKPAPWTPVDSVSWLKAMAWDLRGNLSDEIQKALLLTKLPKSMVDELYPGYDYAGQRTIVDAGGAPGSGGSGTAATTSAAAPPSAPASAITGSIDAIGQLSAVLGEGGAGIGSNSWVVAGSRTTTGKPLLANDPHLGPSLPGIWYQMGLHCNAVSAACPFDVTGFGFSGMPGIIIGHNQQVAWGLTNLGADVTDLFIEKIRGEDYLYKGKWLPLQTRQEVIRVAGGPSTTITVRSTVHGPIVSNVLDDVHGLAVADSYDALALRWTALDPSSTMDAVFELDTATDWTSFRAAAKDFATPAQNMIYADRAGNIGYQAPGAIPIRKAGDGSLPVPGWTGAYDWTGDIPFNDLPTIYNPPSGVIVTANNAVVGPAYPYLVTSEWSDGYRSDRIADLIESAGKLDVDTMQGIQLDTRNPFAATLTPYLLNVAVDRQAAKAQQQLRTWDYGQPTGSAAAAYFNAVWSNLLRLTFTDDISATAADPDPDGGGAWFEVVKGLLTRPDDPWWHNAKAGLRTRDDVLRAAQNDAAAQLTKQLGNDPAKWRWGDLHQLELTNQTLGVGGPAPVQWLLNRGPYALPGGNDSVDANGWDARDGYTVDWGPSMRMVVDLANLDGSRWINLTGASGHAFDAHYVDQAPLWARGTTVPWPSSRTAVDAAASDRLTLSPPSPDTSTVNVGR